MSAIHPTAVEKADSFVPSADIIRYGQSHPQIHWAELASMPSTRERFNQATCVSEGNHQVRHDLFFPCFCLPAPPGGQICTDKHP
jgi:hypothetical protein